MSFSPRDLIPVLMIIASIWGIFGLVQPRYETIKALRVERQQYTDALDKAGEARHLRGVLLEDVNSVSAEDWDRLNKMLPHRADGIQLARDMDGLARVFGIKLSGFSFSEETVASQPRNAGLPVQSGENPESAGVSAPTETITSVQIPATPMPELRKLKLSFDFHATYADFLRYLRELEKNLELSDVRSLTLSRAASSETPEKGKSAPTVPIYSISLDIDTYWVQ